MPLFCFISPLAALIFYAMPSDDTLLFSRRASLRAPCAVLWRRKRAVTLPLMPAAACRYTPYAAAAALPCAATRRCCLRARMRCAVAPPRQRYLRAAVFAELPPMIRLPMPFDDAALADACRFMPEYAFQRRFAACLRCLIRDDVSFAPHAICHARCATPQLLRYAADEAGV